MIFEEKQKYTSKNWLVHSILAQQLPQIFPYLQGQLLDIGCGHKPYREDFIDKVTTYIGLEHPATPSLSEAVDVYGTGIQLPFANETFDTIVSFAVLEHINEPELMLKEAGRVIKAGGFIIMTVPHIWGLHEEPHDYFRYTKYGIKYLLEQGGFTVINISALAGFWVTYCQRFCYYLEHFQKTIPKHLLTALYYLIQSLGKELDKLHRVETETWAYQVVGQKL